MPDIRTSLKSWRMGASSPAFLGMRVGNMVVALVTWQFPICLVCIMCSHTMTASIIRSDQCTIESVVRPSTNQTLL